MDPRLGQPAAAGELGSPLFPEISGSRRQPGPLLAAARSRMDRHGPAARGLDGPPKAGDHLMRYAVCLGFVVLACTSPTPPHQPPLWTVHSTPLVTIGASESDPGHELAGVTGALRIARAIIVANSGSHELRRYDSSGQYLGAS